MALSRVDEYTKQQKAQTQRDFEGFMQQQAQEDKEVGAAEIGGYSLGQGLVRGLFNKFLPSDELKKARGMDAEEIEIFNKYPDIYDPELYKALGAMHLRNGDIEEATTYAIRGNQFEKLQEDKRLSEVPKYADPKTLKRVKSLLNTDQFKEKYGTNFEDEGTDTIAFQEEVANKLFNFREKAEKEGGEYIGDEGAIEEILTGLKAEGKLKKGKKKWYWLDTDPEFNPVPTTGNQVTTGNPVPPAVAPKYDYNNQPNLFQAL
jgi:hypothetical protein